MEQLEAIIGHPAQQRALRAIAALIADLRDCEDAAALHEFQGELFRHVWEVDSHRAKVRRCLKRLRRGEKLPTDAPDLPGGRSASEVESWRLEDLVYERVARQLRCVGDALAWRACGFDRAFIVALAQNAPAGPMANKEGLDYELGTVVSIFDSTGHFVLLHDLTNCARIADATEFTADGKRWLREVKKSGRSDPRQVERMQQAVNALMEGHPLPGAPDSALVPLETPLHTHVSAFVDAVALTERDGLTGLVVPRGSRGVICGNLPVMASRAHERDWLARWSAQHARLQRRLHLGPGTDELVVRTGDTAARGASLVPFGNFPMAPGHAAELICDYLIAEVHMPAMQVVRALESRGLQVEFPIGGRHTTVTQEQASFVAHRGSRAVTLHGAAITQLLLEFLTLDTVADSVAELLAMKNPPMQPVVVNRLDTSPWI